MNQVCALLSGLKNSVINWGGEDRVTTAHLSNVWADDHKQKPEFELCLTSSGQPRCIVSRLSEFNAANKRSV